MPETQTASTVTWLELKASGQYPPDATPEDVLVQIIEEHLATMTPSRRRRVIARAELFVRDRERHMKRGKRK